MEHRQKTASLPAAHEETDASAIRRPIRSAWQEARDVLLSSETVSLVTGMSAAMLAVFPNFYTGIIPAATLYYLWASGQKFRLPFKVPQIYGGTDYGAVSPGGGGYGKAGGILYLGQDQRSQEELWIENGDARRHGFFLGTTGSGKALPLDTPVLTPRGWVLNGDLRPGDEVVHPLGGVSKVHSIHPQGAIPTARLWFSDGRHADCSLDHLWHVTISRKGNKALPTGFSEEGKLMTAGDLGILSGMYGPDMHVSVPLARPATGPAIEGTGKLSAEDAAMAAREGLWALDYMPSIWGTPEERLAFFKAWVRTAQPALEIDAHGALLTSIGADDAKVIKQIVWSLGGLATAYKRKRGALGRVDLRIMFDGIAGIWPQAAHCVFAGSGKGLDVIEVERLDGDVEMSCIKTDRDDGLYVMENHVVTHNTELLLGVVSQTLMWSSGFMFIDGKGTTEFYARSWTLAKRFGREDDIRVLNFTDPGDDPDAPAGGPNVQSNTLNPFAKGGADQLMNLIVSLMGDAGQGNDMWKNRAMSLVTAAMKALCQMRDSGDILLDVQAIRDFLPLGTGVAKEHIGRTPIRKVEDIPEAAMEEMRTRGGMIELYIRAMRGDYSNSARLALKAFFDTLPGFSIEKALKGDPQDAKASEQYGFLSMQLTKPLGSLADDYGHIFRTPLGEVDIDDVVLNRRILIVLLPALQKAPEEMQNCGKIVVNLVKIMMGNASGSTLQGNRQEIVEAKQTRAPSPFIVVLDEAGYYMVKGIDVMMAQARSLGFMVIVAGQDMAAMQSISPQIAETAAANASIFAAGKTVDGDKTVAFIQKLFGQTKVAVTSGFSKESGTFSSKWVDRMDASFQDVDRVKASELQNMMEGEFYFLFNGTIVRSSTFYIGGDFAEEFSVNKFIKVRGPTDRVPGLNQDVEIEYLAAFVGASEALARHAGGKAKEPSAPVDRISRAKEIAEHLLWVEDKTGPSPEQILTSWSAGLLAADWADRSEGGATETPRAAQEEEDEEDFFGEVDDLRRGTPADLDGLDQYLNEIDGGDQPAREPAQPVREPAQPATTERRGFGVLARTGRPEAEPSTGAREGLPSIEPDAPDRSVGEALKQVFSPETHTRHRGLVTTLMAQHQARKKVAQDRAAAAATAPNAEDRDEEAAAGNAAVRLMRELKGREVTFDAITQVTDEMHLDIEDMLQAFIDTSKPRPAPLDTVEDGAELVRELGNIEGAITSK